MSFDYKFNEGKYLEDLESYIQSTYAGHYSSEKYQATDMIMDAGHGLGFCIGNIMKYAKRFGKKNGYNKSDLMKILHYTMLAMYDAEAKGLFDVGPLTFSNAENKTTQFKNNYSISLTGDTGDTIVIRKKNGEL
jgi:hypothetical protein